jgi:hypothetical protein
MVGKMVVGLIKVSLLPANEILNGKGRAALPSLLSYSSMMATTATKVNTYLHRGAIFSPVAGYMTTYYYDYRDNDDNNGDRTRPTASSASAAGKGVGGVAVTMNAIIEAVMREIIQRGIISMTMNKDDGINVVMMINAQGGSLFGPTIAGAHLALVTDVPSSPAGLRPALGVSVRLLMAIVGTMSYQLS